MCHDYPFPDAFFLPYCCMLSLLNVFFLSYSYALLLDALLLWRSLFFIGLLHGSPVLSYLYLMLTTAFLSNRFRFSLILTVDLLRFLRNESAYLIAFSLLSFLTIRLDLVCCSSSLFILQSSFLPSLLSLYPSSCFMYCALFPPTALLPSSV